MALEQAQMLRKRKIEYDVVAEKVNSLPSRDELESYVCFNTIPFSDTNLTKLLVVKLAR